jgi:Ca2+-binding RTX toxin-like protein
VSKARIADFDLDGMDKDHFVFSAGVTATRIAGETFVKGTEGNDVIFGGPVKVDVFGNEGHDYIRGFGHLSGGNDGFDGDIMFGMNGRNTIFDVGPDDYANGMLGNSLYRIHKAGPQGYMGHEAFVNRFDPAHDKIDMAAPKLGKVAIERHGEEVTFLGGHFTGKYGTEVFVRMEPTKEFVVHVETGDNVHAALADYVDTFFI